MDLHMIMPDTSSVNTLQTSKGNNPILFALN